MEGIRLVRPGRSRSGKGSWVAAVGAGVVNTYPISQHGEQGAYIKALEDRLNYLTARQKFRVDFKAFDALVMVQNLLLELKENGVEYLINSAYVLDVVTEAIKETKGKK